jgi:hypothetical protein
MEEPYNISIFPGTGTVDGKSGDHVLLAPAFTVTSSEIEIIVDRAASVIEAFFKDLDLVQKKSGGTKVEAVTVISSK